MNCESAIAAPVVRSVSFSYECGERCPHRGAPTSI